MSLKLLNFFILELLSCAIASALDNHDPVAINIDDYIDKALDYLSKQPEIKKYIDPFSVPTEIGEKGKYYLKNIKVYGLVNLQRQGNCTLSAKGETVNLVAEIGVKNLRVTTNYGAKLLFFWIYGDAVLTCDKVNVRIEISSIDELAKVKSLIVKELGPYRITQITGGSVVRKFAEKAVQKARGSIISALENKGKEALDEFLKQFKFSL